MSNQSSVPSNHPSSHPVIHSSIYRCWLLDLVQVYLPLNEFIPCWKRIELLLPLHNTPLVKSYSRIRSDSLRSGHLLYLTTCTFICWVSSPCGNDRWYQYASQKMSNAFSLLLYANMNDVHFSWLNQLPKAWSNVWSQNFDISWICWWAAFSRVCGYVLNEAPRMTDEGFQLYRMNITRGCPNIKCYSS